MNLEKLRSYFIILSILAGVLFCYLFFNEKDKNAKMKEELKITQQNLKASKDSLRIEKTKDGQEQYVKYAYLAEKMEDLENLNRELYEEVQKTKGTVLTIAKAKGSITTINQPIITRVDTVYKGDSAVEYYVNANFDTVYSPGNSRNLHVRTKLPNQTSEIVKDSLSFTAVTGVKRNDKKDYEVFFRSNYPELTLSSLEGAYITKAQMNKIVKPKRLTFGVHVGYSPLSYDLTEKQFKLRNQITASAGFNIRLF